MAVWFKWSLLYFHILKLGQVCWCFLFLCYFVHTQVGNKIVSRDFATLVCTTGETPNGNALLPLWNKLPDAIATQASNSLTFSFKLSKIKVKFSNFCKYNYNFLPSLAISWLLLQSPLNSLRLTKTFLSQPWTTP